MLPLQITQAQVDEKTEPFEMPLEIGFVIEEALEIREVTVSQAKQQFTFALPSTPKVVRINPAGKAVAKIDFDPGESRLLRQLEAKDVRGRMDAAWQLVKTGSEKGVHAIVDAFEKEPFWGVRVQWAKALSQLTSPVTVDALVHIVATHTDPRVLPELMSAAKNCRDPRMRATLEKRLDGGLGPRAARAAWIALGSQRADAPLEKLAEGSKVSGISGAAQSGALIGLAETRQPEALAILLQRAEYGAVDERARPDAATAIGELARRLDGRPREQAIEALVDLLRDPDAPMRKAAVLGLEAARATEAMGALLQMRPTLSEQDQADLDRVVARMREQPNPAAARAEKRVESLEAKLIELERRLQRLEHPSG